LFSFSTAFLIVAMLLDHLLPSALVKHMLWSGIGNAGRGLGGFIAGILAILIALARNHVSTLYNECRLYNINCTYDLAATFKLYGMKTSK